MENRIICVIRDTIHNTLKKNVWPGNFPAAVMTDYGDKALPFPVTTASFSSPEIVWTDDK